MALDTSIGATPVARLTLGGHTGNFLLDTGASYSAVDAQTFGLTPGATVSLAGLALPTGTGGRFVAESIGGYRAPAGGQQGRIGTDVLGLGVIAFHYEAAPPFAVVAARICDPTALRQAGLVEIGLHVHYGANADHLRPEHGKLKVPVIGMRIGPVTLPAQVDTGFDDEVQPGIVQANAALIAALRAAGVAMHPIQGPATLGCDRQRTNEYWQVETAPLTVITLNGEPAGTYPPPVVQAKADPTCGGIATFKEPFGQVGASWLKRWGTSVFDGPGEAVWVRR